MENRLINFCRDFINRYENEYPEIPIRKISNEIYYKHTKEDYLSPFCDTLREELRKHENLDDTQKYVTIFIESKLYNYFNQVIKNNILCLENSYILNNDNTTYNKIIDTLEDYAEISLIDNYLFGNLHIDACNKNEKITINFYYSYENVKPTIFFTIKLKCDNDEIF